MNKNIFIFGSISGLLVSSLMVWSMARCYNTVGFENSMLVGYASMLLAFSLIFVGVKNFRDKFNDGIITFGKAFKIGFFISLVASSFYVVAWVIEYYVFMPDFADKYASYTLNELKEKGASVSDLEKTAEAMTQMKESYKNPVFVVLWTYFEILPVGTVVALIVALILRRKNISEQ